MAHTLFVLDVRLRGIEPPIWRTIEVPGAATLGDVHYAIQVAMGWTNSHLHQFTIGDTRYGMAAQDELEDETQYRLEDLVRDGGRIVYEYDFGDGWEHAVTVKKVSTAAKPPRPRCTGGARACPPEDCGGPGGYKELLRAVADPKHEEHDASLELIGDFEPELFKLPVAGRDLRREMEELKGLAEGGEELDPELLGDDDFDGVPASLVEAVLALDPMRRAALSAMIAASLAQELTDSLELVELAAAHQRRQGRGGRKASRRSRR